MIVNTIYAQITNYQIYIPSLIISYKAILTFSCLYNAVYLIYIEAFET